MDKVKLATADEITAIASQADLTPGVQVLKFGDDTAVLRTVVEVDPVICPSLHRRVSFMQNVETHLRLSGVSAYYFQIDAADRRWQETVEKWGAIRTNPSPEYRYKITL